MPTLTAIHLRVVVLMVLLLQYQAALAGAAAAPVPFVPADRTIGGWIPQLVDAPRTFNGLFFVPDGDEAIRGIAIDGSEPFPPFVFASLPALDGWEGGDTLAADRRPGSNGRVWTQLGKLDSDWERWDQQLLLFDLPSQRVVQNITNVAWDPPIPPSILPSLPILFACDSQGRLWLLLYELVVRVYVVDGSSGQQVISFLVNGTNFLGAADLDVHDQLWLLNTYNSENRGLTLQAVDVHGRVVSSSSPDMSDVAEEIVAGLAVDSSGVAWLSVVNLPSLFSWSTANSSRGLTLSTAVTSNTAWRILTMHNDSTLLLAHHERGCVEVIDITQPSAPPASHPLLHSAMAALPNLGQVLYSQRTGLLLVSIYDDTDPFVVAVNATSGAPVLSWPLGPDGHMSPFVQDDTGLLYTAGWFLSGRADAVQLMDPRKGNIGSFPQNGPGQQGNALAYSSQGQLLTIAASTDDGQHGLALSYGINGSYLGALPVDQQLSRALTMRYVFVNGSAYLLVLGIADPGFTLAALDSEGRLAGQLSTLPYWGADFEIQSSTGFTYILVFDPDESSPLNGFNYVGVYNERGRLLQWLSPPAAWTTAQRALSVTLDAEGSVYATSVTYSALAVWTTPAASNRLRSSGEMTWIRTAQSRRRAERPRSPLLNTTTFSRYRRLQSERSHTFTLSRTPHPPRVH